MEAIEKAEPTSAQGRPAQGLRPPDARQDHARRADRPVREHRHARRRPTGPKDLLGRVYEYFLGEFASAEGKRGGEFYTPRSVVAHAGRDARAVQGPGLRPVLRLGRHVRAVREVHRGTTAAGSDDISIFGQESNHTTWRLAKMNLAIRGIDADIRWNNEGSFHRDDCPDLQADFILANPPFNITDWGGERLREDARWKYGTPPVGNANFAWIQHILHHLAPDGHRRASCSPTARCPRSSRARATSARRWSRPTWSTAWSRCPGSCSTRHQIPACLWFLAEDKNARNGQLRDRRGEMLFIDARKLGHMVDRVRTRVSARTTSPGSPAPITPGGARTGRLAAYADVPGFCKAATTDGDPRARPCPDARPLCRRGGCRGRRRALRGETSAPSSTTRYTVRPRSRP